ncbi:hypothetical protein GCM10022234_32440 [Aeromicrobium panaciterrae]|uniref:DnaJ family domain-containing protein n=1 Tax=Aeromicrobium panaciterrae TaxID=363861 RepID=UPI0031DBC0E4
MGDGSARDRKRHEYVLRLEQEAAELPEDESDDSGRRANQDDHRAAWVEIQLQQAMRRGEFDNLPGAGKPIPGIDQPYDPDWWIKRLIERERISVLPPALALRKEDADLDATLDRESRPAEVRRILEDFNARIIDARRQLQGGPPVITALRDVEEQLEAWKARRAERFARIKAEAVEKRRTATRWQRLMGRDTT